MTNLLPPQELRRVRGFFRDRFIGTGSLVAIVGGIAALLALFPVYATVRDVDVSADPTIVQGGFSESEDREELARSRLLLRDLEPVLAATSSALAILSDVLEARPSGTIVTSIFFDPGNEATIILTGTSASREDITAYRDTLARNSRFKSVTVPIGVLAGTAGKTFTLTITGDF